MNIPQVAGRLRARIVQFSGKLSAGLPKVMRRFLAEAIYGPPASLCGVILWPYVHLPLRTITITGGMGRHPKFPLLRPC